MRAAWLHRLATLLLATTVTTYAPWSAQAQAPAPDENELISQLQLKTGAERLALIDYFADRGPAAVGATASLAALLNDPDVETQVRAARAIGAIGPGATSAIATLTRQLKNESPRVRTYSAHALGMIGPAASNSFPDLVELVTDADPQTRREAIKAIRRLKVDRVLLIPALVAVLEKSSGPEVIPALHAIAEVGKDAVPALIEALKHPEARYWALQILAQIGPDAGDAAPAVAGLLGDENVEVRREAVVCLGHLGAPAKSVASSVLPLINDKDPATQAAAVWAAVMLEAPAADALPKVTGILESPDPLVGVVAAWGAARLDPANADRKNNAITKAAGSLTDKSPMIRAAAARALVDLKVGQAGRPDAFDALVKALADGDEAVAPIVAAALIEMGEPAVEKLSPALDRADLQGFALAVLAQLGPKGKAAQAKVQPLTSNADPKIRAIAVVALAAIAGDDPAVVAATAASLADKHAAVRIAAADALAQLGKAAKSAEPALKQHAADADPAVQAAVARALQSVTQ